MKKKYLKLIIANIVFILPFLVVSCEQDSLTPQNSGQTITVTATLATEADNVPPTRITMTQNGLNIDLEWEDNDQIELCIVAGGQKYTQQVKVTVDPINRKKATFSLSLPTGEYTTFDLYGVYGGNGLSKTPGEEHLVVLPLPADVMATGLSGLKSNKVMVLTFEAKNVNRTNPSLSLAFKHLGSLFCVQIKSLADAVLNNVTGTVLTAGSSIFALQNNGSATYNLIDKVFEDTNTGALLPFALPAAATLSPGNTLEFWGWYIPSQTTGHYWPALSLKMETVSNGTFTSSFAKPARTAITPAGRAFYFYAFYDGAKLVFTDADGMAKTGNFFVDARDGNLYNYVTLSGRRWMAENLRYLPNVVPSTVGDYINAYCYVYGYDGYDVEVAKSKPNYQTYGVLYNWLAAMNGASSSTAIPSKVQGICPDGWHLPSHDEWKTRLFDLYGKAMNSAGSDFKATGNLTDNTGLWTYPNSDATNKSGFSVIPGGSRTGSGTGAFSNLNGYCYLYSSTEKSGDTQYAYRERLRHSDGEVERTTASKSSAFTVRCVKD